MSTGFESSESVRSIIYGVGFCIAFPPLHPLGIRKVLGPNGVEQQSLLHAVINMAYGSLHCSLTRPLGECRTSNHTFFY
jgi:hypothetical protein